MGNGGMGQILKVLDSTCEDENLKKLLKTLLLLEVDKSSASWQYKETYKKAIEQCIKEMNSDEN